MRNKLETNLKQIMNKLKTNYKQITTNLTFNLKPLRNKSETKKKNLEKN